MILRARKKLQSSMKRNKNHVVVMFVCMNASNTYFIQCMNACAQHKRQPSVKQNILWIYRILTQKKYIS